MRELTGVGKYADHLAGAAMAVALVTPDESAGWRNTRMWDLGRAAQSMVLAAWELGIGSAPATGVGEDPVQPRLEAVGVPQGANLGPCGQQRGLDGVVGMVEVAQDSKRDRHAPVTGHAGECVEGLSIASLRLAHQVRLHPFLQGR